MPTNAVHLLADGPSAWQWRLQALDNARLVFIKTFEVADDSHGQQLVRRLRRRADAGCHIVLAFDFKGTSGFPRSSIDRHIPPHLGTLAQHPNVRLVPRYVPHGTKRHLLPCDHSKYFITVDTTGEVHAIVGGRNIGSAYYASRAAGSVFPYHDVDVALRGPAARDACEAFLAGVGDASRRLEGEARRLLQCCALPVATPRGAASACLLTNGPSHPERPFGLYAAFEQHLARLPAGERVLMDQAYFLPQKRVVAAMHAAARRGVQFVVLTNAPEVPEFFGRVVATAGRRLYRQLWRDFPPGSVRIYEWWGPASSMHAKAMCFGTRGPVWVGSANFEAVSGSQNDEDVLLVEDAAFNAAFRHHFAADLRLPHVRELQPSRQPDPWWRRGVQRLVYLLRDRL